MNTTAGYNKFAQTCHESGVASDILNKPMARSSRSREESRSSDPTSSRETSREPSRDSSREPSILSSKHSPIPSEAVSSRDSSRPSSRLSEPLKGQPRESSVDLPIFVRTSHPNTRGRKKIKYQSLFD